MPALFVFLLKVNIALIIFCLGYYLVLRKLTFYTLNRVYLGLGIIFSSIYPLINIDDFLLRHQQIAKPVQQVVLNWKAPAEQFIQQPGYWYWATIIFWLGAAVFASRLLVQLFSLYKLYRNSKPATIQNHDVRVTTANISPFSFWQNIYINPDNLDTADLKSILQHEQVHVKEWHTLDILLAEISLVFYWFNPGVWLMKKAVRENIEFLTDRKILQAGMDTKAYQYSLLNVSIAATASAGITNHFNFSTLKKRIKMMNAKRSSKVNLTRYAFLVPAVLICLCVFSASKAELVKNTKVAYKSITASVNKLITITAQKKPINNKPALKKVIAAIDTIKPKKVSRLVIMTDTADNKNFTYTINTSGPKDSTKNYVIKMVGGKGGEPDTYTVNGVKVTKEEFEKTAPKDLQAVGYVGGQLKALPGNITRIRINGKESGFEPTHPRSVTFIKRDTARNFVFVGEGDPVIITGKDGTKISTSKFEFITKEKPATTEFTSALIMIDGKEASEKEMKKLPVSEIEKISVNKDKEMVDKYGDKAKNGVVFITTKKAK
jgi:bla regulator protein BlaR1